MKPTHEPRRLWVGRFAERVSPGLLQVAANDQEEVWRDANIRWSCFHLSVYLSAFLADLISEPLCTVGLTNLRFGVLT